MVVRLFQLLPTTEGSAKLRDETVVRRSLFICWLQKLQTMNMWLVEVSFHQCKTMIQLITLKTRWNFGEGEGRVIRKNIGVSVKTQTLFSRSFKGHKCKSVTKVDGMVNECLSNGINIFNDKGPSWHKKYKRLHLIQDIKLRVWYDILVLIRSRKCVQMILMQQRNWRNVVKLKFDWRSNFCIRTLSVQ